MTLVMVQDDEHATSSDILYNTERFRSLQRVRQKQYYISSQLLLLTWNRKSSSMTMLKRKSAMKRLIISPKGWLTVVDLRVNN